MIEKEKLYLIKQHLAVLIKRGKRVVPAGPEYPTKWFFGEVIDPRTGKIFTEPGAWEFIAEKLEETGTIIEPIIMDKPKGKTGYVLRIPTMQGTIYIKIHFGIGDANVVLGRSFHWD